MGTNPLHEEEEMRIKIDAGVSRELGKVGTTGERLPIWITANKDSEVVVTTLPEGIFISIEAKCD